MEAACYFEHVPLFAGMAVLTPDGEEGEANGCRDRRLRRKLPSRTIGKLGSFLSTFLGDSKAR